MFVQGTANAVEGYRPYLRDGDPITAAAAFARYRVLSVVGMAGVHRELAPSRLPRHETGFAMTVHKAQGSEFDSIALVLPETPTKVLTRELVYTAVAQTMTRVVILGSAEVLREAVKCEVARASGLRERFWSTMT